MVAYKDSLKRWWRLPFVTRSPSNRLGRKTESHACKFCGSVAVVGSDRLLLLKKREKQNGELRHFCDIECANEFKKTHNKTTQYRDRYRTTTIQEGRRGWKRWSETQEANEDEKTAINNRLSVVLKSKTDSRLLKRLAHKGWWVCITCGKATTEKLKSECQSCINLSNQSQKNCIQCNESFSTHVKSKVFCSASCASKHHKKQGKHRRRAIMQDSPHESIPLARLCKQSDWTCASCGCLCHLPIGNNDINEATLDHIIPLSKGGFHLWHNVQLLCRQCNVRKSDQINPGMQLMLPLVP